MLFRAYNIVQRWLSSSFPSDAEERRTVASRCASNRRHSAVRRLADSPPMTQPDTGTAQDAQVSRRPAADSRALGREASAWKHSNYSRGKPVNETLKK